jgi:Domain of unknown function (DUF4124)
MRMRLLQPSIALPTIAVLVSFHVASASAASTIYRCEMNGVKTFSDRPCAADSPEYVPDDQRVSTVKVEGVPSLTQTRPAARSKASAPGKGSIAADQLKHKEGCARIDRSLSEIRSKMRAGYDAKQGERLRERQRKLTLDRREKKCR